MQIQELREQQRLYDKHKTTFDEKLAERGPKTYIEIVLAAHAARRKELASIVEADKRVISSARARMQSLMARVDTEIELLGRLDEPRQHARMAVQFQAEAHKVYADNAQASAAATEAFHQKLEKLGEAQRLERIADGMGQSFGRAFENIAFEADNARAHVRAFFDDIARLMMRQTVTGPLARELSYLVQDSFGGAPSFIDTNPPGIIEAKEAHSGGIMGRTRFPTRAVPASAFAGAPRFHGGTRDIPAILREDEHVLTPPQMNSLVGAASGSGGIDVRIHNEGLPSEITNVTSRLDGDQRIIDVSIKAMSNNMAYRKAHGKN